MYNFIVYSFCSKHYIGNFIFFFFFLEHFRRRFAYFCKVENKNKKAHLSNDAWIISVFSEVKEKRFRAEKGKEAGLKSSSFSGCCF